MTKTKKHPRYLLITTLAILTLIATACKTPADSVKYRMTEETARQMAEDFVRNSPTFTFDSIEDTSELVETLYPDIEYAGIFVFHLKSRKAA